MSERSVQPAAVESCNTARDPSVNFVLKNLIVTIIICVTLMLKSRTLSAKEKRILGAILTGKLNKERIDIGEDSEVSYEDLQILAIIGDIHAFKQLYDHPSSRSLLEEMLLKLDEHGLSFIDHAALFHNRKLVKWLSKTLKQKLSLHAAERLKRPHHQNMHFLLKKLKLLKDTNYNECFDILPSSPASIWSSSRKDMTDRDTQLTIVWMAFRTILGLGKQASLMVKPVKFKKKRQKCNTFGEDENHFTVIDCLKLYHWRIIFEIMSGYIPKRPSSDKKNDSSTLEEAVESLSLSSRLLSEVCVPKSFSHLVEDYTKFIYFVRCFFKKHPMKALWVIKKQKVTKDLFQGVENIIESVRGLFKDKKPRHFLSFLETLGINNKKDQDALIDCFSENSDLLETETMEVPHDRSPTVAEELRKFNKGLDAQKDHLPSKIFDAMKHTWPSNGHNDKTRNDFVHLNNGGLIVTLEKDNPRWQRHYPKDNTIFFDSPQTSHRRKG